MATEGLPEVELNRLLRRVDWRFLLPNPKPRRTLNLATGILQRAVELISADVVGPAEVRPVAYDLAVMVDPKHSTLVLAREKLSHGGRCYTEWRYPLIGPRGATRRLAAAGFSRISCYWPWPSPSRAYYWLPLNASGALTYFWATRRVKNQFAGRIRRAARRILWQVACRTGLIVPVCAIAETTTTAASDGQIETSGLLEAVLLDRWPATKLGPTPQQLSCILLTGGMRSINKCVALVFAEPDPQPRLAVKVSRVPASNAGLETEVAVLNTLHSSHPRLPPGVPKVVFYDSRGQSMIVGETPLVGAPIWAALRRANYRELALKATDWLVDLAQRTASPPNDRWQQDFIDMALDKFSACFGETVEACLVDNTRAILKAIEPVQMIPEQRDFSPWNVMIGSGGELAVLDWESAAVAGFPALDLIYFLTYLAFEFEGVPIDTMSKHLRLAYRKTLDTSSFTGQVRAECLARYAVRVGIRQESLSSLSVLVWLIHAPSDYRRFCADFGSRPSATVLRRSVHLSLWEEEIRRAPCAPAGRREEVRPDHLGGSG